LRIVSGSVMQTRTKVLTGESKTSQNSAYKSTAQIPGLIKVSTTGEVSGSVREVLLQLAEPCP
jgi:hypothetical protein